MARILTGVVTSDKADKTIIITLTERRTHPLYKKQYTVNTKFMAHDPGNDAKMGDLVNIKETRPLSARKRFILDEIIERAGTHFEESDATADIPEEELNPQVEKPVEQPVKDKSMPKTETGKEPAEEAK